MAPIENDLILFLLDLEQGGGDRDFNACAIFLGLDLEEICF